MLSKIIVPTILVGWFASVGACAFINTSSKSTNISSKSFPGTGVTVRPANSDWIEEQFTTEVVNIGLEALGYTVENIQQFDYETLLTTLASGDSDFTTGFYTVGYDDFFENAGGEKKLEKMGVLVPGSGQQSILIDQGTATQYQITNIAQLQAPNLAELFDTDGDGKANLAGCQREWQCSEIIEHFIDVYGLTGTVEQDQGTYADLVADVLARHRQDQPFMLYAYSPHWVLLELKLNQIAIPLEVPFTSLPGDLKNMTAADTTVDNKNLGLPVAAQVLLANQQFVDNNPVARRWFETVKIPVEAMNAESLRIREGEDTPEDIRRHAETWVAENQKLFNSWIEQTLTLAN